MSQFTTQLSSKNIYFIITFFNELPSDLKAESKHAKFKKKLYSLITHFTAYGISILAEQM